MLYMVTFTINIPQMLVYIPYMDPMGYWNMIPLPRAAVASAPASDGLPWHPAGCRFFWSGESAVVIWLCWIKIGVVPPTKIHVGLGFSLINQYGYGSIPINTIFRGMNIHKSQLFWCSQKGYKVLTHCHINQDININKHVWDSNDGIMNGEILGKIMLKYIEYNGERILMVLLGLEWDSTRWCPQTIAFSWCK